LKVGPEYAVTTNVPLEAGKARILKVLHYSLEILVSHGGEDTDVDVLGFDAVWTRR
jgi:hypothetical protein